MPGRYLGREDCQACLGWREEGQEPPTVTREHLEVCQGYAILRAGKDLCVLKDRTKYFMTVMAMRSTK